MSKSNCVRFISLIFCAMLMSCGESKNNNLVPAQPVPTVPPQDIPGSQRPPNQNPNRVDWKSVPPEYNPSIDRVKFGTDGLSAFNLNFFDFSNDVQVRYSNDLVPGEAVVQLYKVSRGRASWGKIGTMIEGNTLNIYQNGNYSCSIRAINGRITHLEGGCLVKIQVLLPISSRIQIYNKGVRVTE